MKNRSTVRYFSRGVAPCWRSPMWQSQAEAEGLTLLVADNKTGYYGVYLASPGSRNPYEARVRRGGKLVHLGCFATAKEAALCIARTPEGRAKAAAARPLTSEEARQQADVSLDIRRAPRPPQANAPLTMKK